MEQNEQMGLHSEQYLMAKMTENNIPCMILAAGRGERMRPLTDHLPKPLLEIHGRSLLDHHLLRLKDASFKHVVINHAWLGHLIEQNLGDGSSKGLSIQYSAETEALETAGGIRKALPLLQADDYFFVINGDVYAPDFPFDRIADLVTELREKNKGLDNLDADSNPNTLAYLFLVQNPEHHPKGDFFLNTGSQGYLNHVYFEENHRSTQSSPRYTFSGAGIYHKSLFNHLEIGVKAALAPLLKEAMAKNQVFGELLSCPWHDVGTPQRLEQLNQSL